MVTSFGSVEITTKLHAVLKDHINRTSITSGMNGKEKKNHLPKSTSNELLKSKKNNYRQDSKNAKHYSTSLFFTPGKSTGANVLVLHSSMNQIWTLTFGKISWHLKCLTTLEEISYLNR